MASPVDASTRSVGTRVPLLVLALALGLSLVGAAAVHDAVQTRAAGRLDAALGEAADGVVRRIGGHAVLLRSAAAFVDQDRSVHDREFHDFVRHFELGDDQAGLQGIGYAPLVPRDGWGELEDAARADGRAGFRIWPVDGATRIAAPVVFLEPPDQRNRQVLGFDLLSEPVRRAAAARACATREPSLTGRVSLLPELDGGVPGFNLFLPLAPAPGAVDPAMPCRGFVYASFRGHEVLHSALDLHGDLHVRVFDEERTPERQLYDSLPALPWSGDLRAERRIDVGGRRWILVGVARGSLGREALMAPLVGLIGLVTSVALFLSTRGQVRARRRAEQAVDALRREEAARATLLEDEREVRRHAEEARALIDGVFQAVPAGLAVLDANLRIERVNQALAELTALEPAQHAGRALGEVLPSLDAAGGPLRAVQERGAPLSTEMSLEVAGVARTYLVSGAPVRATDDGAAGVVAVLIDITERKREEARVRRERDVLEVLLELGKEMNAQLDRQVLIQRLAEIARTAAGADLCVVEVDGEVIVGRAGVDALTTADLARRSDALTSAPGGWWRSRLTASAPSRSGEILRVTIGHAREGAFEARHQAMIAGLAQQATVALENARLFQESQLLIGALARSNQALARSNRELDQFAYAASHDLKAPLRGIASLSHWIEEDLGAQVAPGTRRYLELMRGRVQRLENLVDGLLRYARAGRSTSGDSAVALRDVLDEVAALIPPPPPAQVVVPGELPVVTGDRISLEQVFMNLIGNALKHAGRADVTVRVAVVDQGDHWQFTVADDGVGIAPEFHDRIWGMFQTLQPRDKVDSTGIGLALVRKVIETRGGRTWVDSAIGQGATFHADLAEVTSWAGARAVARAHGDPERIAREPG